MTCRELREALGGYVLDALEPDERDAVAAHLDECPACAAEHARLAGLPVLLARADGLEIPEPPSAVEERLLDRVARERSGRRPARQRRRLRLAFGRAAVVAAVAGCAVGVGATAAVLGGGDGGGDAEPPSGGYELVLKGAAGATARAELEPGRGGTEVHLWVRGLPPGAEAVYEVKCERSGWSASAGTFRADAHGRAYVVLSTAARLGEYERIRVVRRSGSADTDVLSGEIQ